MKKYEVIISAVITKWITVEADNEDEAVDLAHEEFNSEVSLDEKYQQETVSVEEIEPTPTDEERSYGPVGRVA